MHGPTRRAGSVGGVRNIKNVSRPAKAVMEHTGHVMLVGEGAHALRGRHGFSPREPAYRTSRKIWLLWEGDHLESGLVGAGIGGSELETSSPHDRRAGG